MSPVAQTAPALPAELESMMRQLKMPYARALAPELIATARAQRWEPTEIIKALFVEEITGRSRSMLATRRKAAGFPTGKTFDTWDETVSSIPAPTQQALRTLEWIERKENLVVCGPSGTGKTFFLEALGQHVVEAGMRVAWFTLEDLGALIRAHRTDDTVTRAVSPHPPRRPGRDRRHRAAPGRRRRRRRALPARRRRLRETLHRDLLEPAPRRLRRAHAEDPRHRDRRPAPAPRPRLPDQRRLDPPHPSPRRERRHPNELTDNPDHGRRRHTLVGRSVGHHRAVLLATSGQFYWPPMGRISWPLTCDAVAISRSQRREVR